MILRTNDWRGEAILKDKLIILDPGHGGRDPGAVSEGICEKELNLKIAARLYILLKNEGLKVKMTRNNDCYLSLEDRVRVANEFKPDIFISIHCNASGFNEANGIETLYFPGSIKGKVLAEVIQENLITKLKRIDRGIKKRTDLFVLKYTAMPAVLIECGFITNPGERKLLDSVGYRKDIAAAILSGLALYYEKNT